ncbi:hypothetical protein Bca101_044426 [Brassica carinata]
MEWLRRCRLSLPQEGEHRNWADLPPELKSLILHRLSTIEIVERAEKVCRSWRSVCKDPSMWRKIEMCNPESLQHKYYENMCRHAVDRSQGGLVEIHIWHFCTDSLLSYIAHRFLSLPLRTRGLSEEDDVILWKGKGDVFRPCFDTNQTWKLTRVQQTDVQWHKGLWFAGSTPKYSVMAWITVHNRLATGDLQEKVTDDGLVKAVVNLPLLEDLEVLYLPFYGYCPLSGDILKVVGQSCSNLKTFKTNCVDYRRPPGITKSADVDIAIAENNAPTLPPPALREQTKRSWIYQKMSITVTTTTFWTLNWTTLLQLICVSKCIGFAGKTNFSHDI